VFDGGKVFISDPFTRARERLGVSVQRVRPRTPTDKAIVEATPRGRQPLAGNASHQALSAAAIRGVRDGAKWHTVNSLMNADVTVRQPRVARTMSVGQHGPMRHPKRADRHFMGTT